MIFDDVSHCFNICVPKKIQLVSDVVLISFDAFKHLQNFFLDLTEPYPIIIIDADSFLDEIVNPWVKVRIDEGFRIV
jgi:hypothetical protein